MHVIIYGDFNCPCSYLASLRADLLIRDGTAQIDWRAVEHDRGLAVTGTRSETGRAAWDRELAEAGELALPGERVPAAPPPVVSNTQAAVAAYAEAVSDGVQDELRRRLFGAIWAQGRHLSSAYEVRRVITGIMWPADPVLPRLLSPDLPGTLDHDTDLTRIVRRSGGTIAPDGGPLTTAGYHRIRQWRQEWQALPQQVLPSIIGPDSTFHSGVQALGCLADLAGFAGAARRVAPVLAGGGAAAPHRRRQPQVASRAS